MKSISEFIQENFKISRNTKTPKIQSQDEILDEYWDLMNLTQNDLNGDLIIRLGHGIYDPTSNTPITLLECYDNEDLIELGMPDIKNEQEFMLQLSYYTNKTNIDTLMKKVFKNIEQENYCKLYTGMPNKQIYVYRIYYNGGIQRMIDEIKEAL